MDGRDIIDHDIGPAGEQRGYLPIQDREALVRGHLDSLSGAPATAPGA